MRIGFFEVEPWECTCFEPLRAAHDVVFEAEALDAARAAAHPDLEVASPFVHSRIDAAVLEALPRLRLIATRSTGYDHIDLDACARRGVAVANVPSYGEATVAEHVFALLLGLSHNLVDAANRTRRGDFSQAGLRGFDLCGRTFGVIGTGAIGRRAAAIARGFGMPVLAHDQTPDAALAERVGFRYVDLQTLLEQSDVVSLHVPGGPATERMIGEAEFARMKPGAVLINTARGSVVDVQALLRALASGKLRAAGLDVLPEEPAVREEAELLRRYFEREHNLDTLLADHILLRLRNVLITPHSAFNTEEALQRILAVTRGNIEAFAAGRPRNLVRAAPRDPGREPA